MEIRRIGENQIRCALTETEIQDMGFEIDDIIKDREITQKFMRVVLRLVEEQEDIDLDHVSPMVKAELLQDHSMAITFGGESDMTFQGLIDTINELLGRMNTESMEEFVQMSHEEKQAAVDKFLAEMKAKAKNPSGRAQKTEEKRRRNKPMTCALKFTDMEPMLKMAKVCFRDNLPGSSLYKLQGAYYLILDFTGFSKTEMQPFAFGAVEYDSGHYSEDTQIAHIKEHGNCIVKNEALQTLIAL